MQCGQDSAHKGDQFYENVKDIRRYASFFEWPEKHHKELEVVLTLNEALQADGEPLLGSVEPHCDDPPDCVGTDSAGRRVGIEVTELVDQEVIEHNVGAPDGRQLIAGWTTSELLDRLGRIVGKKDSKCYNGGPYERLILVIHCDEAWINSQQYDLDDALTHFCSRTAQISEAYLLFSYRPAPREEGYYPYFRPDVQFCPEE